MREFLDFSEPELKGALDLLAPIRRALFAASCAERIRPCYSAYALERGIDPTTIDVLSDSLWENIVKPSMTKSEMRGCAEACFALVTPDEEGPWTQFRAYGEDAASATGYAWSVLENGASQESVWAARYVYDSLDSFVLRRAPQDKYSVRSKEAYKQPLIQAELCLQQQDIMNLRALGNRDPSSAEALSFRSRSTSNAHKCLLTEIGAEWSDIC